MHAASKLYYSRLAAVTLTKYIHYTYSTQIWQIAKDIIYIFGLIKYVRIGWVIDFQGRLAHAYNDDTFLLFIIKLSC